MLNLFSKKLHLSKKKMRKILYLIVLVLIFSSCLEEKKTVTETFKFNNPDLSQGLMTPEILWSLGRIGDLQISPDKSKVLYNIRYYSIEQNKSKSELYIYDLKENTSKQLTDNNLNEISPVWRPDGKKIAFLSADNKGIMQIFEMNTDGTLLKQVTSFEQDVTNFLYSPNLKYLLYTSEVKIKPTITDIYADLPNANVKIYTDLMFRHWDNWEDEYFSHIFVANFNAQTSQLSDIVDIMLNEPFDSPLKPLDGIENINWSTDCNLIAYTCKKLEGKAYALSTNSDIYIYNISTKQTSNISEFNKGYDRNPVFSNNGNFIAWESMQNDGYESDKNRLVVYDLKNPESIYISDKIDQNFHHLVWNSDDSKIYFYSPYIGTEQLFCINLNDKKVQQISTGDYDYTNFVLGNDFIVTTRTSMIYPADIFKIDLKSSSIEQLTNVNKDIYSKLKLPTVRKYWVKTTDNKQMLTWIIVPPDFDSTKKYPALLYCQGGPQSIVSQFFSYRWNFHIMAANGYIVVAPNRRGLPGFGQEWNAAISKDFGGQDAKDLLAAIDYAKELPFVDKDKLGAVGASYGGFSIFWLAGNHNNRFKAFIAHAGIYDFVSMYGATEETFFANWDYGNSFWNPSAKNSYSQSPHLFVKNWNTPIMIVQGGKDFRVPETQAFEAFTAAKLMGVDAKLLYFPEENHWILKPQNGILWQREFFAWLDKYLKK